MTMLAISPGTHPLPGLHACVQPIEGSHPSLVQESASLQSMLQETGHVAVVISRAKELRLPPLGLRSSEIARTHVPFGFSPRKAARPSSGTRGEALTLLA